MVWSEHPLLDIWLGENGYSILFTFSTIVYAASRSHAQHCGGKRRRREASRSFPIIFRRR